MERYFQPIILLYIPIIPSLFTRIWALFIMMTARKGDEKMIVIGICDGEQTVRSLLASYVEQFRLETGTEIQLLAYSTGEKLLKNYMLNLDLIFLEIPLMQVNGLKIAEHIKQHDTQTRIVFLTTMLSHVLEAYEVGASNYILKPLSYAKFCKELSRVQEEKKGREGMAFLEQNKNGLYKIYFDEVKYIETNGKSTLVHTENGQIPSNRQMKQYEQLFSGTSLVRCHAGFIVNLRYFQKLEGSMLLMRGGDKIPISRSRKKQVLSQIEFLYGGDL